MHGDSVQMQSTIEQRLETCNCGINSDTCPPVQLIITSNSPIASSLNTKLLYARRSYVLPIYT